MTKPLVFTLNFRKSKKKHTALPIQTMLFRQITLSRFTLENGLFEKVEQLTAFEAANHFLPNTMLAVLSACETGLVEINGSEGVYGLQRFFKIAGVHYIIKSLWKVPDYQTSELMTLFYSEWFPGKTVYDALKPAQNKLIEKYPRQPFILAWFILIR